MVVNKIFLKGQFNFKFCENKKKTLSFQFNVPYHGFPLKLCFFWQVQVQANDTPASSTKRKWTENLAVGIESLRIKWERTVP
jgi:hypothetical protein